MTTPLYTDKALSIHAVGAGSGGECYLVEAGGSAALVDTGFVFCQTETLANIRAVLGQHSPQWLLLTHSHYDHAGAAAFLRDSLPGMQVVASQRAAEVLVRPHALEQMCELDKAGAAMNHHAPAMVYPSGITVDRVVGEGDALPLGSLTMQVLEAPGHTRDSLAFWVPQLGLLLNNETAGVAVPGQPDVVTPACLVGFAQAEAWLQRATELNPRIMLMPHNGVLVGQECADFLQAALHGHEELRAMVMADRDAGLDEQQIVEHFKQVAYLPSVAKGQPEAAFDLNAGYIIKAVLRDS